jgi:putative DNA primase/helicase
MNKNEQPTSDKKDLSATGLVKLAERASVKLFHTPGREPFASFWVKNHWENWPVKSSEFGEWFSSMCFHHLSAVPSQNALADARNVLSGRAMYGGNPEQRVHARLAGYDGAIYLDLGNASWEMIRITAEGWDVIPHAPVKFVRASGMQSLPHPIDGGKIDDLRPFLNLVEEDPQPRFSLLRMPLIKGPNTRILRLM